MSEDQDQGERWSVDDHVSVRSHPPITSTTHILPFERLSPLDFERLCLWLVEREGYTRAEHLGLAGSEQGRDVIAYKPTSQKEELWYFQCKRYRSIRAKTLKDEVDKYLELAQEKPHPKPFGVVFVVSCAVSVDVREEVSAYCEQHNLASEFWALTELDLRIKQYPDLLREFFGLYTRPIGLPFQAPPLPAHFIPRQEVSDALKDRLLTDEPAAPGILVVSAIHGLGGIGKSVLAAALAHDPEMQERFHDGVLWATLGQQPELLSLLSVWIQALGDYDFHPTTVEAASTHLRTLLHDKAVLLVVDDVWEPAHALPFKIGGPGCQVLITTRRADVADEVGAELHQLDVMTEAQSLNLLSARLGRTLARTEQEEARCVAEAVGYLPLALELAAARVARGMSWVSLRDALEEEIARLEALEDPRRRRKVRPRLEASFNLSLNALRADDEVAWQCFVLLSILPEDIMVAAPVAATLWGMHQAEASEMLELLWNDALLLPGPPVQVGEQEWHGYRLHDLLHDVACRLLTTDPPQGLGFALPEAHAHLLKRYWTQTRDGLWHTLSDDGYIHAHLTWHMERAGRTDEIHALLREETAEERNCWYEARERLGQTAGYLEDVTRAWQLAEDEFTNYKSEITIALQCRYALIAASLNSLAKGISPVLLMALVENELWSPAQGLAYARQAPHPKQQAMALISLAPYLPESLLREALAAAWAIEQESSQVATLVGLSSHLSGSLLRETLAGVCAIERESLRAKTLVGLAPYLPKPWLSEALAAARKIRWRNHRARTLTGLVPYLPESLRSDVLQEGLALAQRLRGKKSRVLVFTGLAPYLSESLKHQALQKAFEVMQEISNDYQRFRILIEFTPRLAELGYPKEALAAVQRIRRNEHRTEALVALASYLPGPLRDEALRKALATLRETRDDYWRARRLEKLAPRLARLGCSEETLAMVQEIEREYSRARLLVGIAAYLPNSLKEEALVMARTIEQESSRAAALAGLAPYLSEPLRQEVLQEALTMAWGVKREPSRAGVLVRLARYLPELLSGEALQEALLAVREIKSDYQRLRILTELAPQLAKFGHPEEALEAVKEIQHKDYRAEGLAGLASHLPRSLKTKALREALTAARAIEDEQWQAEIIAGLASQLAELGYPEDALAAARVITEEKSRAEALVKLAPHLQLPLIEEALTAARAIEWTSCRAQALGRFALRLAELGRAKEALAIASEIRSSSSRAETVVGLASYLPQSLLREALAVARKTRHQKYRVRALAGLVPHLSEPLRNEVLREALVMVRGIRRSDHQAQELLGLIPCLSEHLLEEALATALVIEGEYARAGALKSLAPNLPAPLLAEALRAARAIQNEWTRAKALAGLVPYLPEPLLQAALDATQAMETVWQSVVLESLVSRLIELGCTEEALLSAQGIGIEWRRVKTLISLIPHLPRPLLPETLAAAQAIVLEDERIRDRALAEAVLQLVELGRSEEAMMITREIKSIHYKAEVLTELNSRLPERLVEDMLIAALAIEGEYARAGALKSLAPNLPAPLLAKALRAARAIQDEWARAEALAGLVPYLPEPLLEAALDAAPVMTSRHTEVLRKLALQLAKLNYPDKALAVARSIGRRASQVGALASLAQYLSEPLRGEVLRDALAVARGVEERSGRDWALKSLVFPLAKLGYPEHALVAAQAIQDAKRRLEVLVELAPQLAEFGHSKEALTAACGIQSKSHRTQTLAVIIPYLPEPLKSGALREPLAVACAIRLRNQRAAALTKLVPQLMQCNLTNLYSLWCETLHTLAADARQDFYPALRTLTPVLTMLGGPGAVVETIQAVKDVSRWWP